MSITSRGIMRTINAAACKMFGFTPDELIGKNVSVLMHGENNEKHDAYMTRYLGTGQSRIIGIGREVLGRRRDGTTFPLDLAITEFSVRGERRFLGLLRDVSERKAHEERQAALAAREAHQRGKTEIAAGVLHDLGNVLSGIGSRLSNSRALVEDVGALDNLRRTLAYLEANREALEQALGAKAQPLIHLMRVIADAAAYRDAQLTSDLDKSLVFVAHAQEVLSTYRRYSGAGSGPTRERLAIDRLLIDAQLMMSDAVRKRGGVIQVHSVRDLPPLVCERAKVMQILLNLLKNALESFDTDAAKGASAPAPSIVITAREEGPMIAVEIADNGPGFTPEVAAHLFEPGFSTKERGSGLGLVGCLRIARSLGGDLTLTSAGPGEGARARLTIPRESP
ncbi:MAG: PAS domain-containing sensor histidine kinase [Myxococcales bacterium]|nr:PAS domain-containing sensor histidine kinase [Myxococcales bacterium]